MKRKFWLMSIFVLGLFLYFIQIDPKFLIQNKYISYKNWTKRGENYNFKNYTKIYPGLKDTYVVYYSDSCNDKYCRLINCFKVSWGKVEQLGGDMLTSLDEPQTDHKKCMLNDLSRRISESPSKKYFLRFKNDYGLELVTPDKPIDLLNYPVKASERTFDTDNVVWSKDESKVAITYVFDVDKFNDREAHLDIFSTISGNLIRSVNLGVYAFYGINENEAFTPKVSPDGKYIATQTDLIQSFSIFNWNGALITKQPTAYNSVKLFSDEMYELDAGTYSPFLNYEWTENSKSIKYNFEGGDTIHTLDLSKDLR